MTLVGLAGLTVIAVNEDAPWAEGHPTTRPSRHREIGISRNADRCGRKILSITFKLRLSIVSNWPIKCGEAAVYLPSFGLSLAKTNDMKHF
jgi:hypothetical protein